MTSDIINFLKRKDINISDEIILEYNIKNSKSFKEGYIKTIHDINRKMEGNCIFCGSFVLKYYGLISRDVKDIDIISFYNIGRTLVGDDPKYLDFKVNSQDIFFISSDIYDIDVDVFNYNDCDDVNNYKIVDFYGESIKIQDIKLVMKHKKHLCDLFEKNLEKDKSKNKRYYNKHKHDINDISKALFLT